MPDAGQHNGGCTLIEEGFEPNSNINPLVGSVRPKSADSESLPGGSPAALQ
jgi:hypothetical protein